MQQCKRDLKLSVPICPTLVICAKLYFLDRLELWLIRIIDVLVFCLKSKSLAPNFISFFFSVLFILVNKATADVCFSLASSPPMHTRKSASERRDVMLHSGCPHAPSVSSAKLTSLRSVHCKVSPDDILTTIIGFRTQSASVTLLNTVLNLLNLNRKASRFG